jgi:hypothetical protein
MKNKLLIAGIMTILTLITIQSATATNTTVYGSGDLNYWIRTGPNTMTSYVGETIYWYNNNGVDQSINVSPYSAYSALRLGETDSAGTKDIYWVCDYTADAEKLCIADYSQGDVDTIDISGVYDTIGFSPTSNVLEISAITNNFLVFTGNTGGLFNSISKAYYRGNLSKVSDTQLAFTTEDSNSRTSHTYYSGNYIFTSENGYSISPSFANLNQKRFEYNSTNLWLNKSVFTQSGTEWYERPNTLQHCYPENDNYYYCVGSYDDSGILTYMETGTKDIPFPLSTYIGLSGLTHAEWYNYNGDDQAVITNGTGPYNIYYWDGTNLQNSGTNLTTNYERGVWSLQNNYVMIPRSVSGEYLITNELGGTVITNQSTNLTTNTTYTINETHNFTITGIEGLRSIELFSGNNAIITYEVSGDAAVTIYNYNTINSFTETNTIDINENDIYSTSKSTENLYITTNDGVYVYTNITTTPSFITQDKYGFLKNDDMEDVNAINDTTAYVCDNGDEPDYYELYQTPSGELGGGCRDIEKSTNTLYVDTGDYINIFNTTNKENPTYLSNFATKTSTLIYNYGDLIDVNGNYLATITGTLTFALYDISIPTSPTLIASCNTGGAGGAITSIEYIGDNNVVAGTSNGYINICDTTNDDPLTNTNYYNIDGIGGEFIQGIEHDGTYLHIIGTTKYSVIEIGTTTVTINTPPTVDNVIVSTEEALLGQDVDVQIIAGNIEPLDVIHYGLKCNGTESTFTDTWDGIFTCTYTEPGIYNLTAAVTDNFHLGTWYDETTIQILVLDEEFTGGIMRVLVLDPEQLAIENATVNIPSINVTGTTSEYGTVTLITPEETTYSVTASAYGYYESTRNLAADGLTRIITLSPLAGEGGTALIVDIIDRNGAPVENALVSYTNIYTYVYDYGFTDGLGRIIFTGLEPGELTVSASKDDADGNELTTVADNQTTMLTITLQLSSTEGTFHVERNCVDNGLWLCGNVTWDCTEDSECLSNECGPLGECSRFNYSRCDDANKPRSGGCVVSLTINSWVDSLIDWFFRNLLVVIIFLVIIIALGVAMHSLRDR